MGKKLQYVVNVCNEKDDKCFLYSVLAAKHRCFSWKPADYEQYMDSVDSSMLHYPVRLKDISKFEDANDLSINVIAYTAENDIHPLRCSRKHMEDKKTIYLLFLSNDKENGEPNYHYCVIMDIEGFLRFDGSGSHKKFYCLNCLSAFTRQWTLAKHRKECFAVNKTQRLNFPQRGKNFLTFEDFSRKNMHNWIVYADFESILVPIEGPLPNTSFSSTTRVSKHEPISYGYVFLGPEGVVEEKYYFGRDAVEQFIEAMTDIGRRVQDILSEPEPLIMTKEQVLEFQEATHCFYCEKVIETENKVRDHCHVTGKYRGAAHTKCNLKARENNVVPICFHGLENYDGHLLVRLADKFSGGISVIARNAERYQSITTYIREKDKKTVRLRFLDTFNFQGTSLATLVENYERSGGTFEILRSSLESRFLSGVFPSSEIGLLTRKGYYPYDYVTNQEVFKETELPSKEAFFSLIKEESITDEEYAHAKTVWNNMKTKTFATYHSIYQMTDVLLLAEAFENFRRLCSEIYQLDPCYYVSTPGLSWAAALKTTRANLELFTHVNKHTFITSAIRGGLSYIAKRHSVANNRYFPESYDPAAPTTHLVYWDCNNLYGVAMVQSLPYDNFKWLKKEEIRNFDVTTVPDDGPIGYILEVDLDYPEELHKDTSHNCYPLAPEKMTIEDASDYTKCLGEKLNVRPSAKLVSTLYPKKNYVVHYRNLKFYLEHGLKLKHIKKILQFHQRPWLQPFIEGNTVRRQNASNTFEKDLYKLMNNSTFGKTMERKENRTNVKIVTTERKSVLYTSLPHADSFNIINENLITVLLKQRSIMCDLPIYSGFAILELSKLVMYEFHYKYVKPTYGAKAKLLFTDTDSLAYEIETDDIYDDMARDSDRFDTSNYPKEHPLYSETNKQVLGKFKDEMGGDPIKEFVGLRSKMYSILSKNTNKRRAKGINKMFTKKHLKHEAYLSALKTDHEIHRGSWMTINSKAHEITTNKVTKSLLSPYDDKRFILNDGITTYAHGHYLCNPKEMEDDFDSDVDVASDMEKLENEKSYEKDEKDVERAKKLNKREIEEKQKQTISFRLKKKRDKRETMSEEMKETDRLKGKIRGRKRRAEMSEEEKTETRKKEQARWEKRRAEMSEEQKTAANERKRQLYAAKKNNK